MVQANTPGMTLYVIEALNKDLGRALARIDPEDLLQLQATVNDLVEVTGKRRTICKPMPLYPEFRGQSKIQLDVLSRENAGVGLDEEVSIRKIAWHPAHRVVISPANLMLSGNEIPPQRDLEAIASLLDGLPVLAGDRIRATLFGSRWTDFIVEKTVPKGPVLIHATTELGFAMAQARIERTA